MYRRDVPRELRALVPFEIVALLVVAWLPRPETVPIAMPLVIVAALARWVRGRALIEPTLAPLRPGLLGIGVGLVALAVALGVATPVVDTIADGVVMWPAYPMVRGNPMQAAVVALVVVTIAGATELALRGWIVARALELRAPAAAAVAVGALAEAVVTPGGPVARLGAALFGAGLGWMYVAGGRSLVAPMAARVAFALGALVLEALRIIG